MTIPQAGHPLFVWQKSEQILEHRSFVLKRRNTDEHYAGTVYSEIQIATENIFKRTAKLSEKLT